jgi:hypothetical protein
VAQPVLRYHIYQVLLYGLLPDDVLKKHGAGF